MNDKVLPALSVNKGCSSRQSPAAPTVSLEGTQGKNRLQPISHQPLQPSPPTPTPRGAPGGDSGCKNTGSWLQRAEVHIKGMISVSPESASSHTQKNAKFISLRCLFLLSDFL